LLADLLRIHWDHFYLFSPDYYRKPPETAQVLDQTTAPFWRVSHYLEYPGLELWQMHNNPMAHFELLEREKLALTYGIHAIFSYRHVGAHLPMIWNWDPELTPADKGTRYLFSNTELTFYRGDSLKSLGVFNGVNAYELKNWKPRFEKLTSDLEEKSIPCPTGYSEFKGLCVLELRDGHMQIKGQFSVGDTLWVRERAYPGWRYRLEAGPWMSITKSEDHFLHLPITKNSKTVELDFFPRDFYLLSGLCLFITLIIPLPFFMRRKRKR
jgi:hypothetical protein